MPAHHKLPAAFITVAQMKQRLKLRVREHADLALTSRNIDSLAAPVECYLVRLNRLLMAGYGLSFRGRKNVYLVRLSICKLCFITCRGNLMVRGQQK